MQTAMQAGTPLSPKQTTRSPDATPMPSNPNPKLSSAIPSLSHNARRTSTLPSSVPQRLTGIARFGSENNSPSALGRAGVPTAVRRGPSTVASSRSMRSTSFQSTKTPSIAAKGRVSVSGRSQRAISMNMNGATPMKPPPTRADPPRSPVATKSQSARQVPRPSMESVTVVSPERSRNSPASPRVSPPVKSHSSPVQPLTRNSPPVGKRVPQSPGQPSPTTAKTVAPKPLSPSFSPKITSSPKATRAQTPAGLAPPPQDLQTTPKSTPSRGVRLQTAAQRPPLPHATLVQFTTERPGSQASVELPGVPWSSSGTLQPPNGNHLDVSREGSQMWSGNESYMSKAMGPGLYGDDDAAYAQNGYFNETGTDVDGAMTLDMVTDVDENEFDEDLQVAFNEMRLIFMKKLIHYKRLLEQAQASSASQLHALQAELRLLRVQVETERKTMRDLEARAGRDREALFSERRHRSQLQLDMSTGGGVFDVAALRGDGRGSFDETEVKRVVRSLRMSDRMRLIHLILDSCLPGDVSQMIRLLEKYAASTFDIVASLPQEIAARILSFLTVQELLEVETVSKGWQAVVHHPSIWRRLCLDLTWCDPVPLKWPENANDWEPLYKSLHHRERNFALGLAQSVRFLRGHTNFCTTLILKGSRLISGSYDETIRVWDVRSGKETHCLRAKAISCLDFLPEDEVLVAGFHDVGRVQVFSTVTWTVLQTLQGHLYGIRSVAMTKKYVVSAGADKALVCWDWRSGQKIVRFGQQTNLSIGVQIVDDETVVGVTVDGIVRTFSILRWVTYQDSLGRKEMLSQFKMNELAAGDPVMSARLAHVGVGANNMLQWFAAKGRQMTCATKNIIMHLEWTEDGSSKKANLMPLTPVSEGNTAPSPTGGNFRMSLGRPPTAASTSSPLTTRKSLGANTSMRIPASPMARSGSRLSMSTSSLRDVPPPSSIMMAPPKLLAVVETPDVAVGTVDPLKRRVTTATRFSSRAGADRRIFLSTYNENRKPRSPTDEEVEDNSMISEASTCVDLTTDIAAIGGAWAAIADGPPLGAPGIKNLPPDFKGLATPGLNPMSMALSHEEVVVGCADGTIYVMSFVGFEYGKPKEAEEDVLEELEQV
ncbi:hypothetical protein FRB99_008599 [Tulasnella sp. 403]|nr:hypothetical protein FRB99_008599 [Tulasnella sp. 403]